MVILTQFQLNISYGLGEIALQSQQCQTENAEIGGSKKLIWFLELYISGSTNLRKIVFYRLKLL